LTTKADLAKLEERFKTGKESFKQKKVRLDQMNNPKKHPEGNMSKKVFVFFIPLVFLTSIQINPSVLDMAQTEETESRVPELNAFHEVIYPIWHTAYPDKDFQALREFVPQINRLANDLYKASLPGILRDKKANWEAVLEEMRKAVEDYNQAASKEDDEALLNAAESLHAKFEMMVRIIRPVLKEVDEFHKVLYVVYHKYLPNKEFDRIRDSSQELIRRAESITTAQLPQRLAAKSEPFSAASQELLAAAKSLAERCAEQDQEAIERAVDTLHTKYQNLEKIFD
jgi:methyl-accepting chemotaxis protein